MWDARFAQVSMLAMAVILDNPDFYDGDELDEQRILLAICRKDWARNKEEIEWHK